MSWVRDNLVKTIKDVTASNRVAFTVLVSFGHQQEDFTLK